ncbi:MAG: hypothetical protein K6D91_09560 [Prevotella sp.]|nr:hypothetical protein [Prevotella sp.]
MARKRPIREFNSLNDIELRKAQLADSINSDEKEINLTWQYINLKEENASISDRISSAISYGLMAYDGVMTIRKLKNRFGSLRNIFRNI